MRDTPMPDREPALAANLDIIVRPLREDDLATADHLMRLAFGTFLGYPEPTTFAAVGGQTPRLPLVPKSVASSSAQILRPTGAASVLSVR
jgi:hypothetical protein